MSTEDELTEISGALTSIIAAQKTLSLYGWKFNHHYDTNYANVLKATQKKLAFLQRSSTDHYESECLRYIKMVEDCNSDIPKRGKEVKPIKEKIAYTNNKITANTKTMGELRKKHSQTTDMREKVQRELEDIIKFTQEVGGAGKSVRQHDVELKIAVLTNELHEIFIELEGCGAVESALKSQLNAAKEELLVRTENCPCNMFSEIKKLEKSLLPPNQDYQADYNYIRDLFKKFNKDYQRVSESELGVRSYRSASYSSGCDCCYAENKCPCCDKVWSSKHDSCRSCDRAM